MEQTCWAIDGTNISSESNFIKELIKGKGPHPFKNLSGKKGALFSTTTLQRFIKEEVSHDDYSLTGEKHRSIRTFSSGEQRKLLLKFLISKNPDFLVLDNIFDMLDKQAQLQLKTDLNKLSKRIPIIQTFRRIDNLLPFIKNILVINDNKILFQGSTDEYRNHIQKPIYKLEGSIPKSYKKPDNFANPIIQFKDVNVNYGNKQILRNINWEIKQGDFWQLTGPNGSGKTTLLTMITGDNSKAYGQNITLFGQKKGSGENIWEIKEKIGYVTPAMTTLFSGLHTVENMIISGVYDSIGLYNKPTSLDIDIANQWLQLINLTDYRKKRFSELNEGQQCMILIARSMIKHPPLLILDEPSHGLDDYSVSILTEIVNKIAEESETTIIYVSHKPEDGLNPKYIFELKPGENGSTGKIIKYYFF